MRKNKKKIQPATTPEAASPGSVTPDSALIDRPTPNAASPAPNIKFVGRDVMDRDKRKILKAVDPLERFSVAGEIVKLPPGDFQKRRRLFYHESAGLIARTFPNLYKLVSPKGK